MSDLNKVPVFDLGSTAPLNAVVFGGGFMVANGGFMRNNLCVENRIFLMKVGYLHVFNFTIGIIGLIWRPLEDLLFYHVVR